MSNKEWGSATWILFHTLAQQIKEDEFIKELMELMVKHHVKGHIVLTTFENEQVRLSYKGLSPLEVEGAISFIKKVFSENKKERE